MSGLRRPTPPGIYDHYVEHGWPKAKFSYDRPGNILEPVWSALIDARELGNYRQAKWLSLLYFGFSDAPKQIEGMVFDQLRSYREQLDNNRRASRHISEIAPSLQSGERPPSICWTLTR